MSGKDGFKSASPVCFSLRISFAFSLTSPNTMDSGPFGGKRPDLAPPSSKTDRLHYLADVYFAFPRTSTSPYAHNSIDDPCTSRSLARVGLLHTAPLIPTVYRHRLHPPREPAKAGLSMAYTQVARSHRADTIPKKIHGSSVDSLKAGPGPALKS
jgi:hypothetical protein